MEVQSLEPRLALTATPLLVHDINPNGSGVASPSSYFDHHSGESIATADSVFFKGAKYFAADDGSHGVELWKSDGTPEGTVLLKDIRAGGSSSSPRSFTVVGDKLFFVADDGVNGEELWVTDGTPGGTALVKDIFTGSTSDNPNSSSPSSLTVVGDKLFFVADDGVNGEELWVTDGTADKTTLVKDIYAGSDGSYPSSLTGLGDKLLFVAEDGEKGGELWVTDGTAIGTKLVKDIYAGSDGSYPSSLTAFGGAVFFAANDGKTGDELWKTDGTASGTVRVKDIYAGLRGSHPSSFTAVGKTLFFAADDGKTGYELWKTDGTAAGTVLVRDIYPGSTKYSDGSFSEVFLNGSEPTSLIAVGNTLFFTADTGGEGRELWMSDGSAKGTKIVKDIYPGKTASLSGASFANSADPQSLTVVGNVLYFTADDGVRGRELWKTNGVTTVLVADIATPKPLPAGNFDGIASGTWSGKAVNGLKVSGTFFVTVADGVVSGTFTGTDSGTITGTVDKDGNLTLSAQGRYSVMVWSGKAKRESDGTLSATGVWNASVASGAWSSTIAKAATSRAEVEGSAGNGAPATADDLGASFQSLAGGITRAVVTGECGSGDDDYFKVPVRRAGESFRIVMDFDKSADFVLVDAEGNQLSASDSGSYPRVLEYVAPEGVTELFVQVRSYDAPDKYRLTITANANLSSNPGALLAVPGALAFVADNGVKGFEPWVLPIVGDFDKPTVGLAAASDSGTPGDGKTTVKTPTFTGTAPVGAKVNVYRSQEEGDLEFIGVATVTKQGTWSLPTPAKAAFNGGAWTITAKTADLFGIESEGAPLSVTFEYPAAPTLSLDEASDSGDSGSDAWTSVKTPTFSGVAKPGSTVTLLANGKTVLGTATAAGGGAWSVPLAAALKDGAYSITATATDGTVTSTASTAVALKIDTSTTVPSVPVLVSDLGFSATDKKTSDNTPTFSGKAEPFATVTLYEGDGLLGSGRADAKGAWAVTTSSSLSKGTHSITAKAVDGAGNASAASKALAVEINADVTTSAPTDVTLAAASDSGVLGDFKTNVAIPTFNGKAVAGTRVNVYRTAGEQPAELLGTTTADKLGNWVFKTPAAKKFANGTYTITAKTFNEFGAESEAAILGGPSAGQLTIDTQKTTIELMVFSPWSNTVSIEVSRRVTGLDVSDFRVSGKVGKGLLLTDNRLGFGDVRLTESEDGLTWTLTYGGSPPAGNYTLSLVAKGSGITDADGLGNALSSDKLVVLEIFSSSSFT